MAKTKAKAPVKTKAAKESASKSQNLAAKSAHGNVAKKGAPSDGGRASPKKRVVLSIGLDKPVKEIIEAAKARGISVSPKYIGLLRKGRSSGRVTAATQEKKPTRPKPAMGPKSTAKAQAKKGASLGKSALIRSMGSATPDEILAAGKARGLTFTKKYIAKVRYAARLSAKSGSKTAFVAKTAIAAAKGSSKARGNLVKALRAAQVAIGALLASL